MSSIQLLQTVSNRDITLVGGKAASLGEMLQAGIAVPPGFVITTEAFQAGMSPELAKEILTAFDKLGAERVAVRSSAVAEDSGAASWAGQLETYLNTKREEVVAAVQNCWQSMQSDHAQDYAKEHKVTEAEQAVAVIVQTMVDSDIAGVLFTANPINQSRDEAVIEAAYGLGELLVQGMITPENVIVNKASGEVLYRQPSKQRETLVYQDGHNQQVPLPTNLQDKAVLTDMQIQKLVDVSIKIEQHYSTPQDIEWAIANDQLYIVQSRPITTLGEAQSSLTTITFAKAFTREESLILCELLGHEADQWLASITSSPPPFQIVRNQQGLTETWFCTEAAELLIDDVYKNNTENPDYLNHAIQRYKDIITQLHHYEMQGSSRNLAELQKYIALFQQAIVPLHIIFFTPLRPETPQPLCDLALKIRGEDALFDNADLFVRDSLVKLYPECDGLEILVGLQDLPQLNIDDLKNREDNLLIFGGKYLLKTLDEFRNAHPEYNFQMNEVDKSQVTIEGSVAYRGIVEGVAQIILRKKEVADFVAGNILVAPMTTPHFLPAMKKAIAFVTDEGGVTCHAAIVARELKTPCIIGTNIATDFLCNGDTVRVDANQGKVTVLKRNKNIESIEWQHFLTRPYSLFGASLWQQSRISDEAAEVYGVKLPVALYIESQRGVVHQYHPADDLESFHSAFDSLVTDKTDHLERLLAEGQQLNDETKKLLRDPQTFDNLDQAVTFLDRLFIYATVVPNLSLIAMHRLNIADTHPMAKLCEEFRAVSLYFQFISELVVPAAAIVLRQREIKHAKEVVNYLTLREIYSAPQELIDERLQYKSKNFKYRLFVDKAQEEISWLSDTQELINKLETTVVPESRSTSLKGQVAYKGKARGTVKLILTTLIGERRQQKGKFLAMLP